MRSQVATQTHGGFSAAPSTSVSSSRTFALLLTTEGPCILLLKFFKREPRCPMKLEVFIFLLAARSSH
jgi:hypothetical protein